jgi:hypothetical protein
VDLRPYTNVPEEHTSSIFWVAGYMSMRKCCIESKDYTIQQPRIPSTSLTSPRKPQLLHAPENLLLPQWNRMLATTVHTRARHMLLTSATWTQSLLNFRPKLSKSVLRPYARCMPHSFNSPSFDDSNKISCTVGVAVNSRPYSTVCCSLLSLHPSQVQTYTSTPCSQTASPAFFT